MRRFSRKRRGGNREAGERPLDAAHWLERLGESKTLPEIAFEPMADAGVPPHLAVVARGSGEEGSSTILSFSPVDGGDALMAALAVGGKLVETESFSGEILVMAPSWSIRGRRRLGLVRADLPFRLKTLAVPELADGGQEIESEAGLEPAALPISTLASALVNPEQRALFTRAADGLQGLAAKHGGSVRCFGRQIELIVAARRVAELRLDGEKPVMTTWGQQKSTTRIDRQNMAGALDDLEGQVRRRLNDRKVREGEEGLRTRAVPLMVETATLRDAVAWPLGGSDEETVDLVGLRQDGTPVAGAVRQEVTLAGLAGFVDGLQALRLAQTSLFSGSDAPVQLKRPDLIIAGESFSEGVLKAMAGLSFDCELLRIAEDKDTGLNLSRISKEEASRSVQDAREERSRPSRRSRRRSSSSSETSETTASEGESASSSESESAQPGGERNRGRRRSRRRGRGKSSEASRSDEGEEQASDSGSRPSFDEISLFELGEPDEDSEPRRRRSGGRRGGAQPQRSKSSDSDSGAISDESEGTEEETTDLMAEGFDELADLPPSLEEGAGPSGPQYEDEEEDSSSPKPEVEAGLAVAASVPPQTEDPPKPRRRAVIVAAADRDSISAAILLARDVRLLEGIWIYPQSDLMHFFREVTTDLKADVPIHIVGFTPSPAGEVLQAVSLYSGQISWYDHHEWPPEDVFALEGMIGKEALHYTRGAGSSVPAVLATSTRRSRFSDKLVDLISGRFTQHDYERWGRLWWWRLGEMANRSGDVRRDIEGLLAGRPSDLAREAGRVDAPPIPDEVEWVSRRDFRLVHFAGYVMVVVVVEDGMDPYLVGRIARERYAAQLSMTSRAGESVYLVTGDDHSTKKALDYPGLAQHLAEKLAWVSTLESDDRVARFVIDDLEENPHRLEEVISEIAMGRSTLER